MRRGCDPRVTELPDLRDRRFVDLGRPLIRLSSSTDPTRAEYPARTSVRTAYAIARLGTKRHVEERVLSLLAEGALATEHIAANLRVAEAAVRVTLDVLRDDGLVDMAAVTQFTGVTGNAAAHWRITDAGRARLEQLRASPQ